MDPEIIPFGWGLFKEEEEVGKPLNKGNTFGDNEDDVDDDGNDETV